MVELPNEAITPPTVIVSGAQLAGAYRLFHHLLERRGERLIAITTQRTADEFREDHRTIVGADTQLDVVDCVTAGRDDDIQDTETTKYATGPANLSQLGVKVTALLTNHDDTDPIAIGLTSLSPLILHADVEQTYQFTHILAQQVTSKGWPLIASISREAHDEQTLNVFYEHFDAILETRTTEAANEFRVRTLLDEPTDWTTF